MVGPAHFPFLRRRLPLISVRKGPELGGIISMSAKSSKFLLAVGGLGLVVHLMFIRWIAYWAYPAPADRSVVNNFFVNAGLSALGVAFMYSS